MKSYYYFAAQLPMLVYGEDSSHDAGNVPFSSAYFRELASANLNKDDVELLDYCALDIASRAVPANGAASKSSFIKGWISIARTYRYALAHIRAAKLKWNPPSDEVVDSAIMMAAVQTASNMQNPLEAETVLDKALWAAIDDMLDRSGHNDFSVNSIYAYLLKLLILERRALFKAEEGFAEYKSLYNAIVERKQLA